MDKWDLLDTTSYANCGRISNSISCYFWRINLICFRCRYEMSNCLFESAYEETLRVCNCVPSFHQVALGEMPWLRICTGTKLKCMKKIFHGIGNYKLVSIPMNRIKWEFIFPFILYQHIFSTKCNTSVSKPKFSLNTFIVWYDVKVLSYTYLIT